MGRYSFLVLVLQIMTACSPDRGDPHDLARPVVAADLARAELQIGSRSAPVFVLEFCALDCPVCFEAHTDLFPLLLDSLIETGLVRYQYADLSSARIESLGRAFPCVADQLGVGASKTLLFSVAWAGLGEPGVSTAAEDHSIHLAVLDACLAAAEEPLGPDWIRDVAEQIGVRATPTYVVGHLDQGGRIVGWPIVGAVRYEDLRDQVHQVHEVLTSGTRR